VITQPVYDRKGIDQLAAAAEQIDIPFLPGILPLRSSSHAVFLNEKVSGIVIPDSILNRMFTTSDPIQEGMTISRDLLTPIKDIFQGVCLMPPFEDFSILEDILQDN
jgi:homocysteine S-methyltransferase